MNELFFEKNPAIVFSSDSHQIIDPFLFGIYLALAFPGLRSDDYPFVPDKSMSPRSSNSGSNVT